MRIEFDKLDQRPGTHCVPVPMSREQLEEHANRLSELTTLIEAREEELRDYTREVREDIKGLESQRHDVNVTYRKRREPQDVEGLWGFDYADKGRVRCINCGDGAPWYATDDEVQKAHDGGQYVGGLADHKHDQHDIPIVELQRERANGTKWFVQTSSGEFWGPFAISEVETQTVLPPDLKKIEPFRIALETDKATAPLLDEEQVSAAMKKIADDEKAATKKAAKKTQKKDEGKVLPFTPAPGEVVDDTSPNHEDCGLPVAWHDPTAADQCKSAMIRAADEAAKGQAARTDEKYGGDEVLNPDEVIDCAGCGTPTKGADLQPVAGPNGTKYICFECESKVAAGEQTPKSLLDDQPAAENVVEHKTTKKKVAAKRTPKKKNGGAK